jgi:septal ring factor EnvC (AmiA/AmiB activator)
LYCIQISLLELFLPIRIGKEFLYLLEFTTNNMKDKERISNLEELMAEVLMRLDRLESGQAGLLFGQKNLEAGQQKLEAGQQKLEAGQQKLEAKVTGLELNLRALAENQIKLNDRQSDLQESMINLVQVVRKNSVDIEIIRETMATKEGLNNLFEAMMNRFDKSDARMDAMQAEINELKMK